MYRPTQPVALVRKEHTAVMTYKRIHKFQKVTMDDVFSWSMELVLLGTLISNTHTHTHTLIAYSHQQNPYPIPIPISIPLPILSSAIQFLQNNEINK